MCRFRAAGVCSNKANVPADLQSAGTEYKDFSIRLLPSVPTDMYQQHVHIRQNISLAVSLQFPVPPDIYQQVFFSS